jgi:hypothetical protein
VFLWLVVGGEGDWRGSLSQRGELAELAELAIARNGGKQTWTRGTTEVKAQAQEGIGHSNSYYFKRVSSLAVGPANPNKTMPCLIEQLILH